MFGIFNDDIFSIPIDQEENEVINRCMISNNPKNKLKTIYNIVLNINRNNSILKNMNKENETQKKYKNDSLWTVFSVNKNKREIKSSTNSSKFYVSEIFVNNWKSRVKRFLINNKQKFTRFVKIN